MSEVKAMMAGTLWKLLVVEGQQVEAGEEIAILESMKMEIPISAEKSGKVNRIAVAEGDFVEAEEVLVVID
ncbi:acetyl-CoA carboxylase biotin carboxyl carrier protein subunit [Solibacillus sp. FSL W7-1464]|uniref:acetyl-CoA carboxylase biotin carboxyl carrier protein subunit n=1 Tax=Solibacillus sp. FSL W7-1464 TaxID=2921706 RepID=UPI0030F5CD16